MIGVLLIVGVILLALWLVDSIVGLFIQDHETYPNNTTSEENHHA